MMADRNDLAFIICLDANKTIIDENDCPLNMFYENEAIKCCESIREIDEYENTSIYGYIAEGCNLKKTTYDKLNELRVNLVRINYDRNDIQFLNTIFAQAHAEHTLEEQNIVYIDLDLYLKKAIPDDVLSNITLVEYDGTISQNTSNELEYRISNEKRLNMHSFNTYFIVNHKGSGFFEKLMTVCMSNEYVEFFNENILYKPTHDDYFYEEGAYDFFLAQNNVDVSVVQMKDVEGTLFEHRHLTIKDIAHGEN